MDKIAANNHFVLLRKEVKKAKAMVSGNLIRKVNKLKEEKSKLEDETQIKKIDDKIEGLLEELRQLKTLDTYIVGKLATLKPDPKHWDKTICDSKATHEERCIARVISKNNIKKQVAKFRSDHKDCDEWINEYIEFREKKKEIKAR